VVTNKCYRPAVYSVLVIVAADPEVALVVVVLQSPGSWTTGMSKRGRHYAGALRTKKEKKKKGVTIRSSAQQPEGRNRNEDGKRKGEKKNAPLARRRAHACRVRSRAVSNAPPHRTHVYALELTV
jgi:hypothetical protein